MGPKGDRHIDRLTDGLAFLQAESATAHDMRPPSTKGNLDCLRFSSI